MDFSYASASAGIQSYPHQHQHPHPQQHQHQQHQQQQAPLQRWPSLWYSDGTLIVRTETHIFRVYRGLLAQHSPLFASMLESPQALAKYPLDGSHGLLIVDFPDPPDEVAYFLSALHDPSYYTPGRWNQPSVLKALLRLSTRYQVRYLREQLILHISIRYPSTLEDFKKRQEREFLVPNMGPDFIQLAEETNALGFLPVAFYDLAIGGKMGGYHRDGGGGAGASLDGSGSQSASRHAMVIVNGREKLKHALSRIVRFLLRLDTPSANGLPGVPDSTPSPPLKLKPCTCTPTPANLSQTPLWASWMQKPDVLGITTDQGWMDDASCAPVRALCSSCTRALRGFLGRVQEEVWEELPGYFGLPPWSVLKDVDALSSGSASPTNLNVNGQRNGKRGSTLSPRNGYEKANGVRYSTGT